MSCLAGSVVFVNTFLVAGIEIKLRVEFAAKRWARLFDILFLPNWVCEPPGHIQQGNLHGTRQNEVRRSQPE